MGNIAKVAGQRLGRDATIGLVAVLADPCLHLRRLAVCALGKCASCEDHDVIFALRICLGDEKHRVRRAAALTLEALGSDAIAVSRKDLLDFFHDRSEHQCTDLPKGLAAFYLS